MNPFDEYLSLLQQLTEELGTLCDLAREKTLCVRNSDLMALDEIMKKEQAAALRFRGLEQRQETLLKSTGLSGVALSDLPNHFPPKKHTEVKGVVEQLQRQYKFYRSWSEVARNTLECNIHEIDKLLSAAAVAPQDAATPGYAAAEPQRPEQMKTDFRA